MKELANLKTEIQDTRARLHESEIAKAIADTHAKTLRTDMAKKEKHLEARKDQWVRIENLVAEISKLTQEIESSQQYVKQLEAEKAGCKIANACELQNRGRRIEELQGEITQLSQKSDNQVSSNVTVTGPRSLTFQDSQCAGPRKHGIVLNHMMSSLADLKLRIYL